MYQNLSEDENRRKNARGRNKNLSDNEKGKKVEDMRNHYLPHTK